MKKYDFDKIIDRTNTNSSKWAMLEHMNIHNTTIPCWIADMDFEMLPELKEAIIKRLECPILGYTDQKIILKQLIEEWYNTRYNYNINKEQIIITTGVVHSIVNAINIITNINDTIILPTPYYHRFKDSIINNNRNILYTNMIIDNNRYKIDYNTLSKSINSTCKAIIICNPHNPTGTIYNKEEIEELVNFCKKHNLKIISDEIHCDFNFNNNIINIVNYNEYTKDNAISLLSLSKTFNCASFKVGFAIIDNKELRIKFNRLCKHNGITSINTFGLIAIETCYKYGYKYVDELNKYIYDNKQYCYNYINKYMSDIITTYSEGTYFIWLNLSNKCKDDKILKKDLIDIAHILPSMGSEFGEEYNGYIRVNLACPKSQVIKIMKGLHEYYGT